MRNISFALTTPQFLNGSKTVTRRLGWAFLKPGDSLMACRQCQGIKAGSLERFGEIEVVSVRRELLFEITQEDCALEGFPDVEPNDFVKMFCHHMKCDPDKEVTRIEFRRVEK